MTPTHQIRPHTNSVAALSLGQRVGRPLGQLPNRGSPLLPFSNFHGQDWPRQAPTDTLGQTHAFTALPGTARCARCCTNQATRCHGEVAVSDRLSSATRRLSHFFCISSPCLALARTHRYTHACAHTTGQPLPTSDLESQFQWTGRAGWEPIATPPTDTREEGVSGGLGLSWGTKTGIPRGTAFCAKRRLQVNAAGRPLGPPPPAPSAALAENRDTAPDHPNFSRSAPSPGLARVKAPNPCYTSITHHPT